jgi:hypothetical protein
MARLDRAITLFVVLPLMAGSIPAMTVGAAGKHRVSMNFKSMRSSRVFHPNAPTSCVIAVAISRTIANQRRIGAKISRCSRA